MQEDCDAAGELNVVAGWLVEEVRKVLTDQEIIKLVKSAFEPLRCSVEIWDHGDKLRFKVSAIDGTEVIRYPNVELDSVREEWQLLHLLQQARRQVAGKGVELQPWRQK